MANLILPRRFNQQPQIPFGQTAGWDFTLAKSRDLTGNGYALTDGASPLFRRYGDKPGFLFAGSSDNSLSVGTSLIADNAWFEISCWIYALPGASGSIFGRGRDGFGHGWSVFFTLNSDATLTTSLVVADVQYAATSTDRIKYGEWVNVGIASLRANGVEPSYVKPFINGREVGRATVTGFVSLRTSTIGSVFGDSQAGRGNNIFLARASARVYTSGQTEASSDAYMRLLYEKEAPYFRRSPQVLYFDTAGGGATTGTLAATETGSDSASLSGAVLVSGALSATESGADTAELSGDVLVQGSLSVTETGTDTAALTGQVILQGYLDATETGSDVAAFSGFLPGAYPSLSAATVTSITATSATPRVTISWP